MSIFSDSALKNDSEYVNKPSGTESHSIFVNQCNIVYPSLASQGSDNIVLSDSDNSQPS